MDNAKRNILLIAARHFEAMEYGIGNALSLGILLVASILKNAGYNVTVLDASLDANFEKKLHNAVAFGDYLFVGFSVMSTQYDDSLRLAKQFKEKNYNTPVVFGGFHPTVAAKNILATKEVDYVFIGQSFYNIIDFADRLREKKEVSSVCGIGYMSNGVPYFTPKYVFPSDSHFPEIDYDILDVEVLEKAILNGDPMRQGRRTLGILTGVGCRFKCAFCWNSIYKNSIARMAPDRIVSYCSLMKDKYNIELFWVFDEHFFDSVDYVNFFYEENLKASFKVFYIVSARSSDVFKMRRYNLLKKCKEIGISYIGVGAESGSQRVLNYINKGITVKQTLAMAEECSRYGIVCFFSFIVGIPSETAKESIMTFQIIQRINKIYPLHQIIGPQVFRPYPGSSLSNDIYNKHACLVDNHVFRKFRIQNLFWISKSDAKQIEVQYKTYNVQSQHAIFEGILSILVWSSFGVRFQKKFGLKRCEWFMRLLLHILRYSLSMRIKYNYFSFYPEYWLVKYIDEKYFTT